MTDTNRTAELVNELLGAKAAAELVRDVLANLPPDAKAALHGEIAKLLQARIAKTFEWDMHNMVNELLRAKVHAALGPMIEEAVLQPAFQEKMRAAVGRLPETLTGVLHNLTDKLKEQLDRALRDAVAGAFRR